MSNHPADPSIFSWRIRQLHILLNDHFVSVQKFAGKLNLAWEGILTRLYWSANDLRQDLDAFLGGNTYNENAGWGAAVALEICAALVAEIEATGRSDQNRSLWNDPPLPIPNFDWTWPDQLQIAARDLEVGGTGRCVTMDQMAAWANRTKKTLERWMAEPNAPAPDVVGSGGKAHEWEWRKVRDWLAKKSGRHFEEEPPTWHKS